MKGKLNFLTAGMPIIAQNLGYEKAFEALKELNLDGMELEFVHGVRVSEKSIEEIKKNSKKFVLTAHGPYYINLNSQEEEKIEASKKRIIETAKMGQELGAYSITFHAAFYMKQDEKKVFNRVKNSIEQIINELKKDKIEIWIRPETTGKKTQWGTLEEIINLSKEFEQVLPCVDFAHIHARENGKFNSYDEFCYLLEMISKDLGQKAIDNFHAHVAGINYGEKGEKNHLIFKESDFKYKEFLKALKNFDVKGVLVCESPNIETDTKLLKDYYLSI